jgi:hypothetical protein
MDFPIHHLMDEEACYYFILGCTRGVYQGDIVDCHRGTGGIRILRPRGGWRGVQGEVPSLARPELFYNSLRAECLPSPRMLLLVFDDSLKPQKAPC